MHLVATLFLLSLTTVSKPMANVAFPLEPGIAWHYEGKVRWTEGDTVHSDTIRWMMRVQEKYRRGNQTIAILDGWIGEFYWYTPLKGRGSHLLVHQPGVGLFLLRDAADLIPWVRANPDNGLDQDVLEPDRLLLGVNLKKDRAWGDPSNLGRPDRMYARRVEAVGTYNPRKVLAGKGPGQAPRFLIALRTLGDHVEYDFVPGLGITRYIYAHHGTVSECEMHLVAMVQAGIGNKGK